MSQISHQNCCGSQRNGIIMKDRYPRRWRFWTQVLIVALLLSAASAQSPKQLWVIQEPDQIVGYNIASFAAQNTVKIPRFLFDTCAASTPRMSNSKQSYLK